MFVLDKSGNLCELRGESTGVLNWTQGSTWFRYFSCWLQNLHLFNILQFQRPTWDQKKYQLQTWVKFQFFQFILVQFSLVQFNLVQFSLVQFSLVQFSLVQFSLLYFTLVQFSLGKFSWFSLVWFSSVQFFSSLVLQEFTYLCLIQFTALHKWGGAHQTSNHLPKPHI